MKNVLSIRLGKDELRRVRRLAKNRRTDVSTVARDLMDQGWVLVLLREYRLGKRSMGSLAAELRMSLSEAIDLLAELGIRSPVGYDEHLQAYAAAARWAAGR